MRHQQESRQRHASHEHSAAQRLIARPRTKVLLIAGQHGLEFSPRPSTRQGRLAPRGEICQDGRVSTFGRSRLIDLRAGEVRLFLRVFFVLMLTIAGHTLLETARDTLFLVKLPPKMLALVYVGVALGMLVVTPLNVRLTRRAGARNALVVSLILTSFVTVWFRTRPASSGMVFALYVFGALSATLLVGQFWLLASTLFSAAQSRRLFALLASVGVLGAIAGAGAATLLLEVARVRTLLTAATVAYFCAALLATK